MFSNRAAGRARAFPPSDELTLWLCEIAERKRDGGYCFSVPG